MITIDDKIGSFRKIINEDIREKYQKEIDAFVDETNIKVSEYKAKREDEYQRLKRENKSKLESKCESIHSKMQKDGQDILLSANKAIYEEFFKDLTENLRKNYISEKGQDYIQKTISEIKDDIKQDDILYLFKGTYERDANIIQSLLPNNKIEESSNIKIGGFEIENSKKTYRMNYSIDAFLESEYANIQKKIKKELEFTM